MDPDEHSYSFSDERYVCAACVSDLVLAHEIEGALESATCSYCGAPNAADISVVLDAIEQAITSEHTDPAEELPFESAEGGYQGTVLTGWDVVESLDEWTECEDLVADVVEAFAGTAWCKRDYFGIDEQEALRFGWERFAEEVKHRTRFRFHEQLKEEAETDPREIPPSRMLEALGTLFNDFGLFRVLPVATEFHRARVIRSGDRPNSATELGTVPNERANLPNRMSPAGIGMFYAGVDEATAVLETYDPSRSDGREIAIAIFRNERALRVLDLTSLPPMPSQFDPANRQKRLSLAFLFSFVRDLTRAVARDERAHTEYVPTQVVTEYVRHRVKGPSGSAIDGILYRSSRDHSRIAVVLFAENDHCGPRDRGWSDPEPFLTLIAVRYAHPDEFVSLSSNFSNPAAGG